MGTVVGLESSSMVQCTMPSEADIGTMVAQSEVSGIASGFRLRADGSLSIRLELKSGAGMGTAGATATIAEGTIVQLQEFTVTSVEPPVVTSIRASSQGEARVLRLSGRGFPTSVPGTCVFRSGGESVRS